MVPLAKGLAGGVPVGACVVGGRAKGVFKPGNHGSTFGGNPLAMAGVVATIDAIKEEGLLANAARVGEVIRAGLAGLPGINEVRGMGLMIGVELVTDRATRAPAKAETLAVMEFARENGVLIGKGGLVGNVLRIKPPMCITAEDADFAIDVLDRALGMTGGR